MTSTIDVVGGAYVEECSFPRSIVYRGSGVRAAAVLAGLGNVTTLHTALGSKLGSEFEQIATLKGFALRSVPAVREVWFRYRHPLGRPDIDPDRRSVRIQQDALALSDALVFGMIESRPQIHARRVVYDPQDGFLAQPFASNGSTAEEIAVVASLSEGRAITGDELPESVAKSLLVDPICSVAVLKCGPQGALVATRDSMRWIHAFPSDRVWKIGSGDVFSAAYAYAWLREGKAPVEAACFASRMVSEYVATRQEAFDADAMVGIRSDAAGALDRALSSPRPLPSTQIYLAGPFFTTAEQWVLEEARSALMEMGFKVLSPIHDIGEGPAREVAPADLHAIENSGLVFVLLDGLDAGSLFEVGYARALGIPVVGVAESLDERPLTMLLGSGCTITDDFATGIYMAAWQLMGDA